MSDVAGTSGRMKLASRFLFGAREPAGMGKLATAADDATLSADARRE